MLIGNNNYKLLYLDTNAIRELVFNERFRSGFRNKFLVESTEYVPCFSYDNLREIRPNSNRYRNVIDILSSLPCLMFYHYRILLNEENRAYKSNSKFVLNPNVMRAFTPVEKSESHSMKPFMDAIENSLSELLNNEKTELKLVVDEWEAKRLVFEKLEIDSDKQRLDYFASMEQSTIIKDLLVENIKLKYERDYILFPSLRMVEFSLFQRAQLTKKPLKINDVMDCMISAFMPHVDAFISEGFQLDVCTKARKHIPEMNGLELYRLSDI